MSRTRRPSPQTIAVLRLLAETPSIPRYGYDLCRLLGLKAGTVYPILIRLTERGLVSAAWEAEPPRGRPPRHLYRLTPAGMDSISALLVERPTGVRPDLAPGTAW